MKYKYVSPIAFSFCILFFLIFFLPIPSKAGKATLIYHMAGEVTSLVKTVVDAQEDSSTGLPIFTLEDGSQVKITKGDIVESLRSENPDKGDAIISFFFPTKGIEMLAGTFIKTGMNFIIWSTNICDEYSLPNRLDGQCADTPGEGRYSWPSKEGNRNWEKTVATPEGQNYSFKFRFSIGVPIDPEFTPDPNSWLLYVRDLSTTSSEISYFYLRLNLFGSVYIDIPKLRIGDKLLVKIPKDIFEKSGYSLSNRDSLLKSMKIEANGYQNTWFGDDKNLATASDLGPIVRVLPPSGTIDPSSTFDIDFIISDTSLRGIKDLDPHTLKVYYNGKDITRFFVKGVEDNQLPYSFYVDTSDKSEQNRRFIASIKGVTFPSGTHEVELSISDYQGHSASEKVVYTVQTLTPTITPTVGTGVSKHIDKDIVLYGTFNSEGNIPVQLWIPESLNNKESIVRIAGQRSGTLWKEDRRTQAYEEVIRDLCTQPLINELRDKKVIEEVLITLELSSDELELVMTGIEAAAKGINKRYASSTTIQGILKNKIAKLGRDANVIAKHPYFGVVGTALADFQASLPLVDLVYTQSLYQALVTEQAFERFQVIKSLSLFSNDPAWAQALSRAEANLILMKDKNFWRRMNKRSGSLRPSILMRMCR